MIFKKEFLKKTAKTALYPLLTALALSLPGFAQAATVMKPQQGGTLRVVNSSSFGSLDPQINYLYWQVEQMLYDGLVTFRKTGGAASTEIVPDLAVSLPKITDHGLTYTFTLRQGLRFSDGEPVTVQAVRHSFIRLFKVSSPNAGAWYSVIKGGKLCVRDPAACTLPGVVINPGTHQVIFHLSHPDPVFLDQLAVPFGAILPTDTPDHVVGNAALPGTGTYMIESYNPESRLVLVRNPYFKNQRPEAQPEGYPNKIIFTFGLSPTSQTTAVENNEYDWMMGAVPTGRLSGISADYPAQIHINSLVGNVYIPLNVNIAPFNNKDARLAVNYAVNRADVIKIIGGKALGTPSCQILPPGMPGYQAYCPYTKNPGKYWTAPDWNKAEYYMKKSGEIGQKVTIVTTDTPPDSQIGIYLQSVLNRLGFKASVKELSPAIQYNFIQNTDNNVQASFAEWEMDYPAPSDFLNTLYGCATFRKGSEASPNISGFCEPKIQALMNKADILALTDKKASLQLWAKIDRKVTDQAPSVYLYTMKEMNFVSKRYKNFVFSAVYSVLPQLAVIK